MLTTHRCVWAWACVRVCVWRVRVRVACGLDRVRVGWIVGVWEWAAAPGTDPPSPLSSYPLACLLLPLADSPLTAHLSASPEPTPLMRVAADSSFSSLFPQHGGGGHPGRPHRHHGARQAALRGNIAEAQAALRLGLHAVRVRGGHRRLGAGVCVRVCHARVCMWHRRGNEADTREGHGGGGRLAGAPALCPRNVLLDGCLLAWGVLPTSCPRPCEFPFSPSGQRPHLH